MTDVWVPRGLDERIDARLWGKESGLPRPYPVVCHLLDTAAVFLCLWDRIVGEGQRQRISSMLGMTQDEAHRVLAFWAAMHDLGKISPPFQVQVPELWKSLKQDEFYRSRAGAESCRDFRHEMASHWALAKLLQESGYPKKAQVRRSVPHQVAQLLGGHHGRFGLALLNKHVENPEAYQKGVGGPGWEIQRRLHFDEVRAILEAGALPKGLLPADVVVVLTGLVITADWLASQTEWIIPRIPPTEWKGNRSELLAHWETALTRAPDVVTEARLGRVDFSPCRNFSEAFPFAPNALQRDIAERLPHLVEEQGAGLVLVTAPTGDGKTEAALWAARILGAASGARGLFFALPTMATADAMFPRVGGFATSALGGDRALTLLHSMAWLSPAYAQTTGAGQEAGSDLSTDPAWAVEAGEWLRGRGRGLLAQLGVGTIDQVLASVLPTTRNMLRLTGLSEKVLIVDEAHAYGPWMHTLLTRLLEWLGAMRVPVVLLSATLTGEVAGSLVSAYQRGRGAPVGEDATVRYPGWLFAGSGGEVIASPQLPSSRSRKLDVSLQTVHWDIDSAPESEPGEGGRRAALREALDAVVTDGGTALVCCTTVAEAQQTYRDLRAAFPALAARKGGLRLLHSRFPAHRRGEITAECENSYGKPDRDAPKEVRPTSILVATQIVEQSLDLDFDLVVTDLAPMAQLLQRAGRCRRHDRGAGGRPQWALPEDRPRLVVLMPMDAKGEPSVPRFSMGAVYDPGLLHRTARLLQNRDEGIAVPEDVQHLIDAVYARDFTTGLGEATSRELDRMDEERLARDSAETHLARMTTIPAPFEIKCDLRPISRAEAGVSEELLTTRLGADTGRVLCLFEQPDGQPALRPQGSPNLPSDWRSPSRNTLETIMQHVVPVPGSWLRGDTDAEKLPDAWKKRSLLRDLTLLRFHDEGKGWQTRGGESPLTYSHDYGLER
ncbi:CRISPR-associated helicase Cas3' [Streptomyces sp. ST2-7A]|uniref:CRISPR-associated helicase Cas3' n=1 Tax=Streptomyces sp. ST2-7A TaxID=2907214 RepID=UPI001F36D4D6|nr:CRISPR-associated helicase Cas3' [Streptomyces sp. ST2-7A]MCE7081677.1 CRISPR-associated helicase Cas3' [Streptomyces sp. ST2-7A]